VGDVSIFRLERLEDNEVLLNLIAKCKWTPKVKALKEAIDKKNWNAGRKTRKSHNIIQSHNNVNVLRN
jgi:hypothetical protein